MTWLKSTELENRSTALFEALVPDSGPAETLEGELVRAVNKLGYRWFNDGDYWFKGYGCETAGPAVAFLYAMLPDIRPLFKKSEFVGEEEYECCLNEIVEFVVNYVEGKNGNYTKNTYNMLEFEPIYEDNGEDEYDEDNGEDEYEEGYY